MIIKSMGLILTCERNLNHDSFTYLFTHKALLTFSFQYIISHLNFCGLTTKNNIRKPSHKLMLWKWITTLNSGPKSSRDIHWHLEVLNCQEYIPLQIFEIPTNLHGMVISVFLRFPRSFERIADSRWIRIRVYFIYSWEVEFKGLFAWSNPWYFSVPQLHRLRGPCSCHAIILFI